VHRTTPDIARRLGLPRVEWFDEVGSTMDVAHTLASEGALAGTLVVADAQTAGRGRLGRRWTSEPAAGLWLTIIERPRDVAALDVLSLRIGLALAPVLEAFSDSPVRVKWPNDLYAMPTVKVDGVPDAPNSGYSDARKLAGTLIEARWRDGVPDWIAIGVGINVRPPASEVLAAGLRHDTDRLDLLDAVAPALRMAASRIGFLDDGELRHFAARDLARGLRCTSPAAGRVVGIDGSGALLIDVASGGAEPQVVVARSGSLLLTEDE
jgi:BirA family biotin operon repressor/biotin-[acetyl-CoA-carboxylase] ligase